MRSLQRRCMAQICEPQRVWWCIAIRPSVRLSVCLSVCVCCSVRVSLYRCGCLVGLGEPISRTNANNLTRCLHACLQPISQTARQLHQRHVIVFCCWPCCYRREALISQSRTAGYACALTTCHKQYRACMALNFHRKTRDQFMYNFSTRNQVCMQSSYNLEQGIGLSV